MGIRIPGRFSRLCEIVVFIFLCLVVVILFLAALDELGPFYGHALDGTIVQVMTQTVSSINETMFQFSLYLYLWYLYTWILVMAAVCLMGLLALYLGFFIDLKLNKKHALRRVFVYLERVTALKALRSLRYHLARLVKRTKEDLKRKNTTGLTNKGVTTRRKTWKTYAWQISVIFIVGLIAFTYRYALFPVPQGWDTPFYIYMIKTMQGGPTIVVRQFPAYALSITIFDAVASLSGLMAEQVLVLLTPLIGIIYMVGAYLLVLTGTKNRLLALLAAIYTSLTFATIGLSSGFYANYLAWALAMYALALYVKTMETKENKSKYTVLTVMMFMLTVLMHYDTFIFLIAIILVYSLLEFLTTKERRPIQIALVICAPIITVAVLSPAWTEGVLQLFGFFSTSYLWQYASQENPYILILAIVGMMVIVRHSGTTYTRLIVSWTAVASGALVAGIFLYSFRIMFLVPIAILAAHGTQAILNRLKQRSNSKLMEKPVLPVIFLLCFTGMVPYLYVPQSMLTPPIEAMRQLYWIEQHYGFQNNTLIVCFDSKPLSANGLYFSEYYYWAYGILGDTFYDGDLLYLIQGLPDSHGVRALNFTGKTIVLPDRLYRMTSIEYKVSRRVSELGIYEVQATTLAQIDQIIRNESIWSEDSFGEEEWIPSAYPWDYNYQITNASGILNISVTPLRSYVWFAIQRWLPAPIQVTSHLILKAKGNTDSMIFQVDVLSDKDQLTWTDFGIYVTAKEYMYLDLLLDPGTPVTRIRLSLRSYNMTNIERYIQVDYVALI